MSRATLLTTLAVLALGAVFHLLMALGLSARQGQSLREVLAAPNEATVMFPLVGALACVMLWRNR